MGRQGDRTAHRGAEGRRRGVPEERDRRVRARAGAAHGCASARAGGGGGHTGGCPRALRRRARAPARHRGRQRERVRAHRRAAGRRRHRRCHRRVATRRRRRRRILLNIIVQTVPLRRARAVPRDRPRRRRVSRHPRGRDRRRHPRAPPVHGRARADDARPARRRVPHVHRLGRGHRRGVVARRGTSARHCEPLASPHRVAALARGRGRKRCAVRWRDAGVVAARGVRRAPRGYAAAGGRESRFRKTHPATRGALPRAVRAHVRRVPRTAVHR
mmetsp:Transcript_2144/g.9736  ORF Transcript_2144/g.9736 Transcript_2144/m.9736 type:complete len:273 (-) Transcript_2144:810-1628(-)